MRWLNTIQIFIKTSVTPKRLKLSLYDGVLSYSQISIILCEKTFFFLFYIGSELQKDICDLHFGGLFPFLQHKMVEIKVVKCIHKLKEGNGFQIFNSSHYYNAITSLINGIWPFLMKSQIPATGARNPMHAAPTFWGPKIKINQF